MGVFRILSNFYLVKWTAWIDSRLRKLTQSKYRPQHQQPSLSALLVSGNFKACLEIPHKERTIITMKQTSVNLMQYKSHI